MKLQFHYAEFALQPLAAIALEMPRLPRLPPATPFLNKNTLIAKPANGHTTFIPQIRKLVFEYCDFWPSSANLRSYIYKHVEDLARNNPHVEFVVKQRPSKEPVIRGFYCRLPI